MANIDVFKPSSGPLLVPGNLSDGLPMPTDSFKKERPATQGSIQRFGQLSHNSFFTRHNPHPGRVRHLKGLLDIPICTVNDDGHFPNGGYSYQFPPNNYDQAKINSNRFNIPVNAINVNSQMHPINTITGLQYFTGLQSYPYREKAVPQMGMVPVTETWREELRKLTEAAGLPQFSDQSRPTEQPRQTVYSTNTGRLIPPPSRAMSRGPGSRMSQREKMFTQMEHIAAAPDTENTVLQMLCQILQTEDVNSVQSWLVSAGDREKTLVLDLIKAAVATQDEYYNTGYQPDPYDANSNTPRLPALAENATQTAGQGHNATIKEIERMGFNEMGTMDKQDEGRTSRYSWAQAGENLLNRVRTPREQISQCLKVHDDDIIKPPVFADVFRQREDRPATTQSRPATMQNGRPATQNGRPGTMQNGRPGTMQNGRPGTMQMGRPGTCQRPDTSSPRKSPRVSPVLRLSSRKDPSSVIREDTEWLVDQLVEKH
ncbi:unnamed protein product [Owenia fusiformis]|nr:unnamed protein product [Owenia fusiformis]